MQPDEIFTAGNMNAAVVRSGDRVHRTAGPQAPTVHRLLEHVRSQGVTWVPRVHGFDDQGREVLDFIPGDVVHDQPEWLFDEAILLTVARELRRWHDATASFPRSDADVWWWQPGKQPQEVICHVDFAPYNHVFRERAWVSAIDYDLCYPGPRAWDLAYTAYRYVPLSPHRDDAVADGEGADRSRFGHAEQQRRLGLFCDAYGAVEGRATTADAVLARLPERLEAMADWCDQQTDPDRLRDGIMYRAHARWIASGALLDTLEA
ncbi:phosphotransferase [Demequina sp. NBRC 110053]|uniref:phosphotransferase n=1 Tax=Demequina sp. NBRC 110053 TaxID=1570342 RepID=UPI0009FC5917|nr:phosphotransferase [Demequina sp. NBRC 110053]